jgi:comEA protein
LKGVTGCSDKDLKKRREGFMKRHVMGAMLVLLAVAAVVVAAEGGSSKGVVNINTASAQQLQLLPRVGPALASRIIEFRETNGPFKRVEELVAVRGIGEKSLEQLRPYVVTKGDTTLKEKISLSRASGNGTKS